MNAKDLRIGNWINGEHDGLMQVEGIDGTTVICQGLGEYISSYKGIPLTEQWLKEFGFEHYNGGLYCLKFGSYQHRIVVSCNDCSWALYNNAHQFSIGQSYSNSMDFRLKYVHQLQNLYFALTGEELERNDGNK